MKGYIRKNGKTYQYIFDAPRPHGGKRKQVTKSGFRYKKDAQSALTRAMANWETEHLDPSTSTSLTVGAWVVDGWLPAYDMAVRRSTIGSYKGIVKNHIVPDPLSDVELAALTAQDATAFLLRLTEKPGRHSGSNLSRKTIKNVYWVLKVAFDAAVKQGFIASNPVDAAEVPKPRKREIAVWTIEQIQEFFDHAHPNVPRMRPLYRLAVLTGMRRGELAGLQWRHVDLHAGTIRIEQTLLCADGGTYLEEPKTKSSRRTIHLGRAATIALEQARVIQDQDAEALGNDWVNDGFVFTKPSGEALHPDYITKRFTKDVAETRVMRITLHGLRHTFATTALGAGQNPRAVSDILGHANIQTTLNLYSQYIPGAHAAVVARVEAEMFGTDNGDNRD